MRKILFVLLLVVVLMATSACVSQVTPEAPLYNVYITPYMVMYVQFGTNYEGNPFGDCPDGVQGAGVSFEFFGENYNPDFLNCGFIG